MATTLATEKQADAIKRQMLQIRTDLPYRVDYAREEVNERFKQLTDWKYHMRTHPWPILTGALVLGYMLVPSKNDPEKVVVHRQGDPDSMSPPAKKGLLSGVVGAVATIALKRATTLAADHLAEAFRGDQHADR